MCGIVCTLFEKSQGMTMEQEIFDVLSNRGPDSSKVITYQNILFGGFVLWQQGTEVCTQPQESSKIILLYNGDLYNIDELNPSGSDTAWLLRRLTHCQTDLEILDLLRYIEGPYSVIFFNKTTQNLYFARDSLGRNSLLLEKSSLYLRVLSTSYICDHLNTIELPPLGLYKLKTHNLYELSVFPWINCEGIQDQLDLLRTKFHIKTSLESAIISPDWLSLRTLDKCSFDFYELCKASNPPFAELFSSLIENKEVKKELNKFNAILKKSVEKRITKLPEYCQNCIENRKKCKHAKVAILFSGGIDCSILAVLVNERVENDEPIDLINFSCANESDKADAWMTPDRISAYRSLVELKEICPSRKWNFVEVNATRDECRKLLMNRIKHLINPLNTVLDESLGAAFWFASQADGILDNKCYKSSARIIILGSGADELFGGYRRHRNIFLRSEGDNNNKNFSVQKELDMDWERISSRNLARDDRVIADSKKTPRAPYIEENLIRYVRCLKANQRSCYALPEGIGDKLFLRLYGYTLGLRYSAFLKKRAIQFGSRIANKKQKASDFSEYLL